MTFLTSFTMKHMNLANYTEVLADPPWDFSSLSEFQSGILFQFVVVAMSKYTLICDCSDTR